MSSEVVRASDVQVIRREERREERFGRFGRPPGVRNGEGKRHPPLKTWPPLYDQVVYAHLNGGTQIAIAEAYGLSTRTVHRIIYDPKGQSIVEEFRERARQAFVDTMRDRLLVLGLEAVDRLAETILARFDLESKAKRHQDRVSLEVLGIVQRDGKDSKGRPKLALDKEVQERLVAALEKSNERERLHVLI